MSSLEASSGLSDNLPPAPVGEGASIAAVERDTGVSKDTLRVWERRYQFPVPGRDARGERVYARVQVEQLRLIKRLLDCGYRAGQVVGLPHEELRTLGSQVGRKLRGRAASKATAALSDSTAHQARACYDLVKRHDALALRRVLAAAALELGLARFVSTLVAPLNVLIGEAWVEGRIEIFEEHFYTECVTAVLRNGITSLSAAGVAAPQVLLTTLPQESHGLGLLMAEIFFALDGCHCLPLGVQTPVPDIARAVGAHGAQIVVLSFSASLNPKDVTRGLSDLREQLPPAVEIWTGGACPVLHKRPVPGVRVLSGFDEVAPQLQRWRQLAA